MSDNVKPAEPLSPGARQLVEAAGLKQREARSAQLGLNHWLLALVERHGPMAESLARGLEASALPKYLADELRQGHTGAALDSETMTRQAIAHAQERGKAQATERDLAAVILALAGYQLNETPGVAGPSLNPQQTSTATTASPEEGTTAAKAVTFQPRAQRPTPMLEQFGRDLTREALEGKLPLLIGRELEMQLIIETLCRRTKRNPILVGPAGVGKTAIIEGLAQRMVRGEVPTALRDTRILAIQPSTLQAGASIAGEFEKRMKGVLGEASQDGIILFVDEAHALIGAGGMAGTGDAASLLKPVLARGELSCIAATTDTEFRRFIEPDEALERRFQPIRIQELTAEQTLGVLRSLRDGYVRRRGVQVDDGVLAWLVDFAQQFLRNRYFPDKGVDLLEQCVAYALTQNESVITFADAETVAQRLVGMPLAFEQRLATLRERLTERGLLAAEDLQALSNRLEVTLRGLDLRPTRPNAVVLLLGEVAAQGNALATAIAAALFGGTDRVVEMDFSRMIDAESITMLLGAPPMYVGYQDAVPIHRVAQMPWCVVLWKNVDACHPQVRLVAQQALSDGFLTDARGKRIYLSDAVLLLTAGIETRAQHDHRPLGFQIAGGNPAPESRVNNDLRKIAQAALGEDFAEQVDLICSRVPSSDEERRRWLRQHLLADLAARYRQQHVELIWDDSILEWFMARQQELADERDWERLVDEQLSPVLIRYLPSSGVKEARTLTVAFRNEAIHIATSEE